MAATEVADILVAGDSLTFSLTLSGTGTIAGNTYTATIYEAANPAVALSTTLTSHAATGSGDATRIVTLVLTSAESANLKTFDRNPYTETIRHICDIKEVTGAGAITHYGPFIFRVRKAVT